MIDTMSTQDRLLRAALAVVREHGLAGATSRQIAAAAGTNLQAITYHFGSKDALLAQALIGAVRTWIAPMRALLVEVPTEPIKALMAMLAGLDELAENLSDQLPTYLEALTQATRRPEYRDQIQVLLDELRSDVAQALTLMKAAGTVNSWVDPDAMATLVVAAADGVAVHLAIDPDHTDVDALLSQVGGLLISAMATPR
jgi:AcrR family transcriptional regulator